MHLAVRVGIYVLLAGVIAGCGLLFYFLNYQTNLEWAHAVRAECVVLAYNITLSTTVCGEEFGGSCFLGSIVVTFAGHQGNIEVWNGAYVRDGQNWLRKNFPVASNVTCVYPPGCPADVRLAPPPLGAYLGVTVVILFVAAVFVTGVSIYEGRRKCQEREYTAL